MKQYMIVSTFSVNNKRYESTLDICKSLDEAKRVLRHYAIREGATLSMDELFADKSTGYQYMTYRIQKYVG